MDICVHNFSRALRFGTKYIYQALPRMITIWLDFGQWREISSLPPEAFQTGAAVSKDTKYVLQSFSRARMLTTDPTSTQDA